MTDLQQKLRDLNQRLKERNEALERSQLETVRRLALAAEFRDDATGAHTSRVANTTRLLAERMGHSQEFVELITAAAPLHDVGKVAIPDDVLLKPGALDDVERQKMRSHAEVGARMLAGSSTPVIALAEEIALSHHERWDGTGYPEGLAGESIPVSGRLLAVADVYDALTQARPYKEAWPVPRAVAEIGAGRGTHFDPAAVDAFMGLDHEALTVPAPAPGAPRGRWTGEQRMASGARSEHRGLGS